MKNFAVKYLADKDGHRKVGNMFVEAGDKEKARLMAYTLIKDAELRQFKCISVDEVKFLKDINI